MADSMRFFKMSGAGNDFIVFSLSDLNGVAPDRWGELFQRVCQRSVSVGADGVIVLEGSESHVHMRYFNADGVFTW